MWYLFAAVVVAVIALRGLPKGGFLRPQHPDAVRSTALGAGRDLLLVMLATAVVAGLAEVVGVVAIQKVFGRLAFWELSAAWMTPVSYLTIYAPIAVVLAIVCAIRPRWMPLPLLVFGFVLISTLAVSGLFQRFNRVALGVIALGLASAAADAAGKYPVGFRVAMRRALTGGAVATALLFLWNASLGFRESRAMSALADAEDDAPNVLMIVFDTVRARSMSLFGRERQTTPFLERLAGEAAVFDRAMATAPWTLPTHTTLFTGRAPHETSAGYHTRLDETFPLLAEQFHAVGYATGGFAANRYYVSRETGLTRGFIHFESYLGSRESLLSHSMLGQAHTVQRLAGARSVKEVIKALLRPSSRVPTKRGVARRSAAEINASFLSWLDGQAKGRPFFAFLNFFDAHNPYQAPPEFLKRFAADSATELDQYEAAIAYLDSELERLFAELQRRGMLDNTIVVLTADHGESHGDHGNKRHGNGLYEEEIHVPLLVRYPPRVPAVRVRQFVSLRDVPATVLDLGKPKNAATFPGASLARFWSDTLTAGDADILSEVTWGESHTTRALSPGPRPEMKSVIDQRFAYIWEARAGKVTEELYDLLADSTERTNLAALPAHAGDLERLRATIRRRLEHSTTAATGAR